MSLSCDCDYGDFSWYYIVPEDTAPLQTKRNRVCRSCKKTIQVGEEAGMFARWRYPTHEVEERIYGDGGEVPLATWFMCEDCTGLYWALSELGFCFDIEDDMRKLVKEYNAMRSNGHL